MCVIPPLWNENEISPPVIPLPYLLHLHRSNQRPDSFLSVRWCTSAALILYSDSYSVCWCDLLSDQTPDTYISSTVGSFSCSKLRHNAMLQITEQHFCWFFLAATDYLLRFIWRNTFNCDTIYLIPHLSCFDFAWVFHNFAARCSVLLFVLRRVILLSSVWSIASRHSNNYRLNTPLLLLLWLLLCSLYTVC